MVRYMLMARNVFLMTRIGIMFGLAAILAGAAILTVLGLMFALGFIVLVPVFVILDVKELGYIIIGLTLVLALYAALETIRHRRAAKCLK